MFRRDSVSRWLSWSGVFGLILTSQVLAADGPNPLQTAAADGALDPDIPAGQSVKVGNLGQIDLHVKDLELARVLQLLSIQSQRNIVASRNVAGTVSADLYGVEFYEALDAILQPNGFGYREKGNFVYVYTLAELKEIELAERKLTTRVQRVNYLTAADASAFVTPLLSPAGSISISGDAPAGFQPTAADAGAKSFAHTDTLVIRDYSENVDEILALLADLDVRPKQVLIESTVLQAELDEKTALGTDFTILADHSLSNFVKPLNTVDALINGTVDSEVKSVFRALGPGEGIQSTAGNTLNGESSLKFGIINEEFAVFVRALDRVTDTTVVANPKLLVLNRQRADLLVGGRLGYLSTTSTDTSTTQTVEFLDVGTQLTVRPFVSDDEFIRMELRPSISDGTTAAVDGVVIPNETTQELTTNIMVRSGQMVVMGGLFKEDTEASRTQWPLLGDMPLAGGAFKGKDDTVKRQEIIFLIKPSVIKDEALYAMGEDTAEGVENIRLGARNGLLPWSRGKMVAAHMQDAIANFQAGRTNKALWSVDLVLWIEPTNAQARQLKEEITGRQLNEWPGNGVIQKAIDDLVQDRLQASAPQSDQPQAQAQSTDPGSIDQPQAAAGQQNPEATTPSNQPASQDPPQRRAAALESGQPVPMVEAAESGINIEITPSPGGQSDVNSGTPSDNFESGQTDGSFSNPDTDDDSVEAFEQQQP